MFPSLRIVLYCFIILLCGAIHKKSIHSIQYFKEKMVNILMMKKSTCPLLLIFIFILMLLCPGPVFSGASKGLLLWFNTVLPTLFPFILICNLLIQTGTVYYILSFTRPLFCRLFGVSAFGSFAVLSGFLCGYPMGAKVTADLYSKDFISRQEASYLLSFCNNTSPMFILSFLVMQSLNDNSLKLPTLAILWLSPILCSFLFRREHGSHSHFKSTGCDHSKDFFSPNSSASCTSRNSDALEDSISDALESITKIGAYIMIFSIFTELLCLLPLPETPLSLAVLSSFEITNGIALLCRSSLPRNILYILCLSQTSFGGLCAVAQTNSMIKDTGLSILPYIQKKLITALVTSLLAFAYLHLF